MRQPAAVFAAAALLGGTRRSLPAHPAPPAAAAWAPPPPPPLPFGRRPPSTTGTGRRRSAAFSAFAAAVGGDDGGGEGAEDGGGTSEDWRAFRARLVNMERLESKGLAPSSASASAASGGADYDSALPCAEEDGPMTIDGEAREVAGDGTPSQRPRRPRAKKLDPSSYSTLRNSALWAYDVPDDPLASLRPGSVLLYRPLPPDASPGFYGYGLGRQYLHKSIVLVQEVADDFVTGVILNRGPYGEEWGLSTAVGGGEDEDGGEGWEVWFGGDARSLVDDEGAVEGEPVFYCLHDLMDCEEVERVSMEQIPGVKFTTPTNARALVSAGHATPSDFWTFCGYLRWSAERIREEIDDGLWHVVETDPGMLFRELKRGRRRRGRRRKEGDDDEDDAGIGHWDALMEMIVRRDECVVECAAEDDEDEDGFDRTFDDAMLREWMRDRIRGPPPAPPPAPPDSADAATPQRPDATTVLVGDVVRARCPPSASSAGRARAARSPFLLSDHELHKSLVLITQDDENFSVGVVLNIPSARAVEMRIAGDASAFFRRGPVAVGTAPVRYGGPFDFVGTEDAPLFFLHRCAALADAGVGEPVGGGGDADGGGGGGGVGGGCGCGAAGIWRCTMEEATDAVRRGLSSPRELVAINGFCVWEKMAGDDGAGAGSGGIRGEVMDGRFEVVPAERIDEMWRLLLGQGLLSEESISENLALSNAAWDVACGGGRGAGEGSADSRCVSSLADDATRRWIEGFLLGEADFRESNLMSE